MSVDGAPGVRARVREELTRQIVGTARAQLAESGAAALSLRAVARELGMVSSAVYRYVPSRDDLLTRLIIEAYDALGTAAEQAEAAVPREDLEGRWLAICHGVRDWALAHPHEHALIFGSPVPGYRAPEDTIGPAQRVPNLLIPLLVERFARDAAGRAVQGAPAGPAGLSESARAALDPVRRVVPAGLPDEVILHGLMAWTYLLGAVSAELFGHRHNVIADDPDLRAAFFDAEIRRIGRLAGLAGPLPTPLPG